MQGMGNSRGQVRTRLRCCAGSRISAKSARATSWCVTAPIPAGQRGRVALGLTDNDGRFTLTTYKDGDGAIVGRHTVTVGLNVDESTGKAQAFACKDSSTEVTVEREIKEYEIDF